jgi:hypothetical protein
MRDDLIELQGGLANVPVLADLALGSLRDFLAEKSAAEIKHFR